MDITLKQVRILRRSNQNLSTYSLTGILSTFSMFRLQIKASPVLEKHLEVFCRTADNRGRVKNSAIFDK